MPVGSAEVEDAPSEGGFRLFDENTLELVIKVFNGCDSNDRFWVFTSLLVEVTAEVTVTDTLTAEALALPQVPFEAVSDTQALATCP